MALVDQAAMLAPGGRVRLVEVDASEFSGGIHRFHYAPFPHTPEEIINSANQVLSKAEISAAALTRMTRQDTNNGVIFTSNAADSNFTLKTNFPGSKYTKIKIIARWVTPPDTADTSYQIYYATTNHGISGTYNKNGTRSSVTRDLGDGWVALEFDMANLSGTGGTDWVDSTIIRIRVDLWQNAIGSIEVKKVNLMNVNPDDMDESKLGPKPIIYGGKSYEFWPFQLTGLELSTDQAAEPTLSASNLDGHITALCLQFKDMVNAKVSVIDTYAVYLDAVNFPDSVNPTADPTAYTLQTFWMDTKSSEDDEVVTWSLSSPADLQGLVIPTRQITSLCDWALRGHYRSGDGCTYNGTAYFDAKGNAVADPALDVCGGCLSDCRKRFGAGLADPNAAILDYGGFPATTLLSR